MPEDTIVKLGRSIIDRAFRYYEIQHLDDETEFFPFLKVIILGILDSVEDEIQKKELKDNFKDYARELYVSLWLKHAEEDEEDINPSEEKKAAIKEFERIYRKVKV